jgi:hypothetical protein
MHVPSQASVGLGPLDGGSDVNDDDLDKDAALEVTTGQGDPDFGAAGVESAVLRGGVCAQMCALDAATERRQCRRCWGACRCAWPRLFRHLQEP